MEKMQMKQGENTPRDLMQTDLKLSMNSNILQNRMKAILQLAAMVQFL